MLKIISATQINNEENLKYYSLDIIEPLRAKCAQSLTYPPLQKNSSTDLSHLTIHSLILPFSALM